MKNPTTTTDIDICICSFRRAHLAETLQSLAQLILSPGMRISIIVADNDETPQASALVNNLAQDFPYPIRYLHAPARNISIARNACLDAATASFVAFLDDDELATPGWLSALIAQQQQSGADIVLGPVQARYPDDAPAWLSRENFHSIKPVWVQGKIVTGYTSNVLFKRAITLQPLLRFQPELGRSGGEDTAFFFALHRAGRSIDYAPEAIITEEVAPERFHFSWLLKRSFRSGQTHGMILLVETGSSRLASLAKTLAKASFCGAMALGCLLVGGRARFWALRGTLHLGAAARLLGFHELTQYG